MGQGIAKALAKAFGKERILVRTPSHIQVTCPNGKHNIWITKDDTLKLQLAGDRVAHEARLHRIIAQITDYNPKETDLSEMTQAVSLTTFIGTVTRAKKDGVFVDAGWKNGKAKIAVVFVQGERIAAESFTEAQPDPLASEVAALRFAINYNPFKTENLPPIYSDCTGAIHVVSDPRVVWIPRESNVSDKIGNMRGVVVSKPPSHQASQPSCQPDCRPEQPLSPSASAVVSDHQSVAP